MRGRSGDKSNMSYTSCPGTHVWSGSPSHATVRTRAGVWNLLSHGNIAWPEAINGQYMWANRVFAPITITYNFYKKWLLLYMDFSAIAANVLELGSLVISHWAVLSFIIRLNSFCQFRVSEVFSGGFECVVTWMVSGWSLYPWNPIQTIMGVS